MFAALRRDGSTASMMSRMYPFEEFNHLMGLERQRERERAAVPIVEVKNGAPPPNGRRRRSA